MALASSQIFGIFFFLTAVTSILCGFAVLIDAYRRRAYKDIGQRFPLYLVLVDFICTAPGAFETLYGAIYSRHPSPPLCQAIGALRMICILMHASMEAIMAWAMYQQIRRKRIIHWGEYDWKFHATYLAISLPLWIIVFAANGYGGDPSFCLFNDAKPSYAWVIWTPEIVLIPTTLTIIILYIRVRFYINRALENSTGLDLPTTISQGKAALPHSPSSLSYHTSTNHRDSSYGPPPLIQPYDIELWDEEDTSKGEVDLSHLSWSYPVRHPSQPDVAIIHPGAQGTGHTEAIRQRAIRKVMSYVVCSQFQWTVPIIFYILYNLNIGRPYTLTVTIFGLLSESICVAIVYFAFR